MKPKLLTVMLCALLNLCESGPAMAKLFVMESEVGQMVQNSLRRETLVRLLVKKVMGIDRIINTK